MIITVTDFTAQAGEEITILFTSDIHDYIYPAESLAGTEKSDTNGEDKNTDGNDGAYGSDRYETVSHGGAARLKTLLDQRKNENTIYVDDGDFSMGTLIQAAYSTDAYELRNLGLMGCTVTTFGNHEFDYGAKGAAQMLRAAKKSGDAIPQIVQSNIDFGGDLTEEQADLKSAFDEYGVSNYTVIEKAGHRIGFFGVMGYDCIECTQADIDFVDYKKAAQEMVKQLKAENCDIIIALSHTGTESMTEGEDIDLAKEVDGIDLIISGHSHSNYGEPVRVNDTVIVPGWCYLYGLGSISFTKDAAEGGNGGIDITDFEMIRIDYEVAEDAETALRINSYKENINENYLKAEGVKFDDVIAHSNFNMISLDDMYATHQEYTVGNLIADSYIHEAEANGIDDIDVALVGLGTIRGSVKKGNITVADAFEICSLGVGSDGSAGHPIVAMYITGKEIKLLTELDASLGTLVNSIKMSYSGLEYQFNVKRPILDRVTKIRLVRRDGTREEIEDDRLYKVCANMYAANMLGMLNGLTKGILSITPKDENGEPVSDFYDYALLNTEGREIKEWIAFKNYLCSFDKNENGIPEIPEKYNGSLGRKLSYKAVDLKEMTQLGTATNILSIANIIGTALVAIIVIMLILIIKRIRRRKRTPDK